MVLVDIYVPSVDKTYNFNLNDSIGISTVITEITEMIEQKERFEFAGDKSQLNLYFGENGQVLPKGNSLTECSVGAGSRLILI